MKYKRLSPAEYCQVFYWFKAAFDSGRINSGTSLREAAKAHNAENDLKITENHVEYLRDAMGMPFRPKETKAAVIRAEISHGLEVNDRLVSIEAKLDGIAAVLAKLL